MATISIIVADIKLRHVYECEDCKNCAEGDTLSTRNVRATSAEEMFSIIKNIRADANHMPVGWASYWGAISDVFRCPSCVEKRTTEYGNKGAKQS